MRGQLRCDGSGKRRIRGQEVRTGRGQEDGVGGTEQNNSLGCCGSHVGKEGVNNVSNLGNRGLGTRQEHLSDRSPGDVRAGPLTSIWGRHLMQEGRKEG